MQGYLKFLHDCTVIGDTSDKMPSRLAELVFVQVNVQDEFIRREDVYSNSRQANRQEWLEAIVRLSLTKYEKLAKSNAAHAVERFLSHDILPVLPPRCTQRSDTFRVRFCYIEQVDRILEENFETIEALYLAYSALNSNRGDDLETKTMLSVGGWLHMLWHLDLFNVAQYQVTVQDAKMLFVWSRMRSVADYSAKSHIKYRHLYIEDFMEVRARLAREACARDVRELCLQKKARALCEMYRCILHTLHRAVWTGARARLGHNGAADRRRDRGGGLRGRGRIPDGVQRGRTEGVL